MALKLCCRIFYWLYELICNYQVSGIRSCPLGINRLAESLQQKFPAFSKSQLRNKVREISSFVDNRWQVRLVFKSYAVHISIYILRIWDRYYLIPLIDIRLKGAIPVWNSTKMVE